MLLNYVKLTFTSISKKSKQIIKRTKISVNIKVFA